METLSSLSIKRAVGFLFVLTAFFSCKKEYVSTDPSHSSPTGSLLEHAVDNLVASTLQNRTASRFNYNLEGTLVTNYSRGSDASDVSFDDGVYASTKKMTPQNGYSLLLLQGFGFNIPAEATIVSISVKARRFKTGTCGIREVNAYLVKNRERPDLPEWWDQYGVRWADPNNFPITETEINYSQSGNGTTASGQPYLWTPARVNDPYFGVLFQTAAVVNSKGSAVINYDFVDVTVEYSVP